MSRVVAISALSVAACGPLSSTATGRRLHLGVRAVHNGQALTLSGGVAALGSNVSAYSVLMRFGGVVVDTTNGSIALSAPVNVDLVTGTRLLDADLKSARVTGLDIAVPPPPLHSGVRTGEQVSVYIGAVLDGTPLEYRDVAMNPMHIDIQDAGGQGPYDLELQLETQQWFADIDPQDLDEDGGTIEIDELHNPMVAQQIEAAIRASFGATLGPTAADSPDPTPSGSP